MMADDAPRKPRASLLDTVKAVAASFFGVRGGKAHERDMSHLNPHRRDRRGHRTGRRVRRRAVDGGQDGRRMSRRSHENKISQVREIQP
jgi:hypothetical protein